MEFPDDLLYTKEDEWLRLDGDTATIGITDYAQHQLGDVVYVELPKVGRTLGKGDSFGIVESVKAVSDLYTPVGGEVIAVNGTLEGSPELVNSSPYSDGWMIRLRVADPTEVEALLTVDAYRDQLFEQPE